MKTRNLITFLIFSTFCLSLSAPLYAQTGTPKKANEAEVTFSVNIDCLNCQKKIESKLPFEKGVKDLKINLEKHEIWILYQIDKTSKEKLIEAIKKIGYEAKEITPESMTQ
ncbi:MAG: heavy-metal-associated domain-containing protein [Prevotellaceae bacterium]|jgi:copper chaperone CopZ|nr:heavy-metal-associated domain-containing protein [Prevotellaceae bacterium]